MSWPDDYKPWLKAVTAAKTTPLDCMCAVAFTQQLSYGEKHLTVDCIANGTFGEVCSIRVSVRNLRRLGFIKAVSKYHGCFSNEYELTFPEVASVSN